MSVVLVAAVAGLCISGIYLITARSLSRIVLGFSLLGHATVVALLAAGGPAGQSPLADQAPADELANPLPQALSLTAIVIAFGLTLFLLALARRQQQIEGDDLVEADLEERRLRARNRRQESGDRPKPISDRRRFNRRRGDDPARRDSQSNLTVVEADDEPGTTEASS